jgi:glycosyltransferase involved in cell wall biosynthesis
MSDTPIAVLMPVYDDWDAARVVIARVRTALRGTPCTFVLVDDGSDQLPPADMATKDLRIIRLRRNLGHQRAICVGLCWIRERLRARRVVIMDADGEDVPEDVATLLATFEGAGDRAVTFARRRRRSERAGFRALYTLYRWLHLWLTGISVRVGNFSVVGAEHIERLAVSSELWNHYAASVFKSRLPIQEVPLDRGRRLSGTSRMNFVSLVLHGLSAISVFAETVVVRLIMALGVVAIVMLALLASVVVIRLRTSLAIPGWATMSFGILLVLLSQAIGIGLVLVMGILATRQGTPFIPMRDYQLFVLNVSGD